MHCLVRKLFKVAFMNLLAVFLAQESSPAIPKFARAYGVSCHTCHVAPPRLNASGLDFVGRRYQFDAEGMEAGSTFPAAVWVSFLGQQQPNRSFMRGFPNRVEVIASDAVSSRLSYFVEWRVLSLELRGNGSLRDRSGRFEDLFMIAEVADGVSVTAGQFRMLSQVDVSQRLSLSEQVAFSSGLGGLRAGTARLTGLRSFSPSGRSPAVRLQYHHEDSGSRNASDGWFTQLNLPLTGELSIPLTDEAHTEASFEFEAIPKGVFAESFWRRGLTSLGGHIFVGSNERLLAQAVGTSRLGDFYVTGALGLARVQKSKWTNMMLEAEFIPVRWGGVGVRLDHQAGLGRKVAVIPYGVVHFPGTTYTVRLSIEQRVQEGNHQTLVETGFVF
ncbi:MAG: hypothetical protein ACRDGA_07590 [Bacteroidota bacterium]